MADDTIFGVQVLFQNERLYDQTGGDRIAAMKAHVAEAAELGVDVIRFPGDWRALQPTSAHEFDAYYLAEVTETIAYARSLGIEVVMTFAQTPYWATDGAHDPNSQAAIWSPPIGAAADAFAAALVALHGAITNAGLADAVAAWEIWNEPNTTTFWPTAALRAGTDVQVDLAAAADYAALLNASYDALKAVDPEAVVLGGSLAGCDADYLQALYAAGAKFDGLALHPYTKANPFNDGVAYGPEELDANDPLSQVWSFKSGVEAIRDVMIANGDASKAMWFTEFGWSSSDDWGGAGSADAQAAFLAQALAIIADWDFVDAAMAYRLFDGGGEEFGMRLEDGALKPAGAVLRDFLTALHDADAGGGDVGITTATTPPTAPSAAPVAGGIAPWTAFDPNGAHVIEGTADRDTLVGQAGDNWIFAGAGDDTITGSAARDWIEGGAGADTLIGGGYHGHALYWASAAGVTIDLLKGTASGGDASGDRLIAIGSVDGSAHADTLTGNHADNWLIGLNGNDVLSGLGGSDRLDGGAGADVIRGGRGADMLIGGDGADTFQFAALGETGARAALRDTISDFERGGDRIDLAGVDANTRAKGNQTFKWIGAQDFHDRAGELHMVRTKAGVVIEADVNGDSRADFQVLLSALKTMSAADFML
ncbi:MAG: M10 family metallopeptidase C-terminal domain-containing protein [Hyphomicrobium sp.]